MVGALPCGRGDWLLLSGSDGWRGVPGVAVAGALMRGRGGFGVGALYSFLSGFVVLGGVWVG